MKPQFVSTLLFFWVLALIMASCESEENDLQDNTADQQELLTVNSTAEISTDSDVQLGIMLDEEGPSSPSIQGLEKNQCVSITTQGMPGTYPITYILDFGNGCTGPGGLTRTGILEITYTGYIFSSGSSMVIERQNYSINGRALGGTITYTNNSSTAAPDWNRTVINGSLTTLNGGVYTFSSDRDIRISSGAYNGVLADNVYEIYSGSRSVNRPNGTALDVIITSTLVKPYACNYIIEGVISLTGSALDGTLDYGNGTCDNSAVYTHRNGNSRTITLM